MTLRKSRNSIPRTSESKKNGRSLREPWNCREKRRQPCSEMETACPQAVWMISARPPHQIKDRTAVLPFFALFDQPGPQGILLNVIPFFAHSFLVTADTDQNTPV